MGYPEIKRIFEIHPPIFVMISCNKNLILAAGTKIDTNAQKKKHFEKRIPQDCSIIFQLIFDKSI